MLSKTCTTIITLVAALSFGGAAIVPTVAQAKETTKQHEALCAGLEGSFNAWEEEAENPANDREKQAGAHRMASRAAKMAIKAGCDTSGWRGLLPEASPTSGMRPEGGAPQNSPEGGTLVPVWVTATLAVQ
jgi:hypothetical protein